MDEFVLHFCELLFRNNRLEQWRSSDSRCLFRFCVALASFLLRLQHARVQSREHAEAHEHAFQRARADAGPDQNTTEFELPVNIKSRCFIFFDAFWSFLVPLTKQFWLKFQNQGTLKLRIKNEFIQA